MSKEFVVALNLHVLADILDNIAQAISKNTQNCIAIANSAFNNFMQYQQATTGFYQQPSITNSSGNNGQSIKRASKSKPSDIEIAQFVELIAKEQGFLSQGIKLLPESTGGETLEFTIESPEKQEIVQERRLK